VQFFNDNDGVGTTVSDIPCSTGSGGASDEPFPVWEVVSHDGGRTWRTTGRALPTVVAPRLLGADIVYSSPERGWVEAGGAIAYTGDGGRSWRVLRRAGEALEGPFGPDKPGLPRQDLMATATGPAGSFYMATTNELALSRDGGRHWSPLHLAASAQDLL
jgi:photosystem II stability/assembly factor-like uncharacterized protein